MAAIVFARKDTPCHTIMCCSQHMLCTAAFLVYAVSGFLLIHLQQCCGTVLCGYTHNRSLQIFSLQTHKPLRQCWQQCLAQRQASGQEEQTQNRP